MMTQQVIGLRSRLVSSRHATVHARRTKVQPYSLFFLSNLVQSVLTYKDGGPKSQEVGLGGEREPIDI